MPIVYRERAVGVLSVQHIDPRRYEDVEIEALQTTAMVLSELIANAELVDEEESPRIDRRPDRAADPFGPDAGQGAGGRHSGPITSRGSRSPRSWPIDTEAERQRVYRAFDRMREQIDTLASQAEFGVGGEHEEVLETYKMFAYDEGWSRRINEAIDSGLTAEAAIERVQQHTRMRMREIDDALLADRDA